VGCVLSSSLCTKTQRFTTLRLFQHLPHQQPLAADLRIANQGTEEKKKTRKKKKTENDNNDNNSAPLL
jgi:hypothetical protein